MVKPSASVHRKPSWLNPETELGPSLALSDLALLYSPNAILKAKVSRNSRSSRPFHRIEIQADEKLLSTVRRERRHHLPRCISDFK